MDDMDGAAEVDGDQEGEKGQVVGSPGRRQQGEPVQEGRNRQQEGSGAPYHHYSHRGGVRKVPNLDTSELRKASGEASGDDLLQGADAEAARSGDEAGGGNGGGAQAAASGCCHVPSPAARSASGGDASSATSGGSAPVDIVSPRGSGDGSAAGAAAGTGTAAAGGGSDGAAAPLGSTPVTPSAAAGALGTTLRKSSLSMRSFTRDAAKSYQIYLPPQVLVLHLKRFSQDLQKGRLQKLESPVAFEFELDLAPFVSPSSPEAGRALMYDLAGVVVHMGNMRSGHYVAYVKRGVAAGAGGGKSEGPSGAGASGGGLLSALGGALGGGKGTGSGGEQWYYISDCSVRAVSRSEVAGAQAYMLMYVRRPQAGVAASCSGSSGAQADGASAAALEQQQTAVVA